MAILAADWLSLLPTWGSVCSGVLYLAATLLFALGALGCVLPYPGHFVLLGGCILWAYNAGAPYPAAALWVALTLLAIVGSFADNIFALLGAKRYGCSKAAIWCSLLGIIIGVGFFPIGIFLGPFLGAFLGEVLISRRSLGDSTRSGVGVLLGTLAGMLAKFIIAGSMLLLFFRLR